MYAKITRNKNIRNTLHYHEKKVEQGYAECLYAGNFIKDPNQLTRSDKIYHFERRTTLNERITKPIVHLSLNFHSSQALTNQQMASICREFMQKWGFEDQPYLVYRHTDSAHPHAHVVSTVIERDGTAKNLSPLDFRNARRLTQQLEARWALVPSARPGQWNKLPTGPARKIIPGQTPLHPAMRNIFDQVLDHYRYTSVEELNAVLRLYSVEAYRGRPESPLNARRGLLYRSLDENGRPVRKAIKASLFDSKPTLKNLEKRFVQNQALREPHRQHLTTAIDWAFYKRSPSLEAFRLALEKEKIDTILQKDANGNVQNIWYVDHLRKTVFDGKTLGNRYTADDISKRCEPRKIQEQKQVQTEKQQVRVRPRLDHF